MVKEGFTAVLIDYDEDLFTPPSWIGESLSEQGIGWIEGRYRTFDSALDVARDADVVMIQSLRPLLTREMIQELTRCRCIVRLGIGYDNVDVAAATERGILVCNVPEYCVEDVAQHALALLLDGTRHIARQDRWIRGGSWDRTGARPSRRTRGSTLGLVGYGRIARSLVQMVSGLGLNLITYDPYLDAETVAANGARKVELEELLSSSDMISIHCPLTDGTHHLLDSAAFEKMKDGVILVNTSRGPIVDETALEDALESGKVAGAGLDVFEQEPLPLDSKLRDSGNVTFTPHVGANSEESVAELYRAICEITVDVSQERWPMSVVNPEARARTAHSYE